MHVGPPECLDKSDARALKFHWDHYNGNTQRHCGQVRTPCELNFSPCYDRGSLGSGFYHPDDVIARLQHTDIDVALWGDGEIRRAVIRGKGGESYGKVDLRNIPAVAKELHRIAVTLTVVEDVMGA